MRILLTRRAGSPGTKKLLSRYGSDLICVRYRYDAAAHERVKTVELIVERVPWRGRSIKQLARAAGSGDRSRPGIPDPAPPAKHRIVPTIYG